MTQPCYKQDMTKHTHTRCRGGVGGKTQKSTNVTAFMHAYRVSVNRDLKDMSNLYHFLGTIMLGACTLRVSVFNLSCNAGLTKMRVPCKYASESTTLQGRRNRCLIHVAVTDGRRSTVCLSEPKVCKVLAKGSIASIP